MPNHVKNRIVILGSPEQVEQVFEKYNTYHPAVLNKAYDGRVICSEIDSKTFSVGWFNVKTGEFETREDGVSIGLPDGWKMDIEQAYNQFPDFNKIKPQPENIFNGDLGQDESELCKREGRPTWYDWNRDNWGTKWNCYSCEKEKYNSFLFDTAWCGVPDLILDISKQNPDIKIYYEYADEDTGYNCASYRILNGEVVTAFEPEGGSKDAYELAFNLRPDHQEYYVMEDGNYVYKDE